MNDEQESKLIKIAAIITATPRWVAAILAAEGFVLPTEWLFWWIPVSAFMGASMAVVEGWAFAYIFQKWRNQSGKQANILAFLAVLTVLVFVVVLAPYIASSVRGVPLSDILYNGLSLYVWASCVALSTIMIVVSVGYANKNNVSRVANNKAQDTGNLPENSRNEVPTKNRTDWRLLPESDRQLVAHMSTAEIQAKYLVSDRTARLWKGKFKEKQS